jgi:hypothetical protein
MLLKMLMLKGRSQTDVNFETPVSNSVLLNAPTVAGTYTLATDVAAGSGSTVNTAFTQKTFAAKVWLTILLILTFTWEF